MNPNAEDVLLLFENPSEPIYNRKGDNQKVFKVPESFYEKRVADSVRTELSSIGDVENGIEVPDITKPDLSAVGFSELSRDTNFTVMLPKHLKIGGKLVRILSSECCY
jgi:hypothetical protein